MLVKFWGTRGSIPTPGRRTAVFGGNTSCVEVRCDDGRVVLLDCGTGARQLGMDILSRGKELPPIHILVTHTHWDHIQGFPFFIPAYVPGSRVTVYGARGLDRSLEGCLSGQMQYTYFPVQLGELRADIEFAEIGEERFDLGSCRVTTQFLNHTAPTLGYRIEAPDRKIVYCTDHEPFLWTLSRPSAPNRFEHPGEERHLEFVAGADVLIHDSQYIDREYPGKRGWGHSTIEYVTDLAIRAGVKQLVLFHHDPLHPDAWVRQQTARARRRARTQGADLQILAAAEGLEINLAARLETDHASVQAVAPAPFGAPTGRVLLAGSDTEELKKVRAALEPDEHSLATHHSDQTPSVTETRAQLMVLVGPGSETMLLDQVKEIRAQRAGARVPIIVLTKSEGPGNAARLIDGVTDVLSHPFNPSMLRARVRAWLRRAGQLVEHKIASRKLSLKGDSGPAGSGLLRGLPSNERAALLAGALTCRFEPGEIIFREGDPSGGVYFIRSGRVQIGIKLPDGQEQVLTLAKVGDTVGELAALDGGPRTATAKALDATTADYVSQEMFVAGLSGAPGAVVRLMSLMARRLRRTDRLVGELAGTRPDDEAGDQPKEIRVKALSD